MENKNLVSTILKRGALLNLPIILGIVASMGIVKLNGYTPITICGILVLMFISVGLGRKLSEPKNN